MENATPNLTANPVIGGIPLDEHPVLSQMLLPVLSQERSRVEYLTQVMLGTSAVSLHGARSSVLAVANPHLALQFDKRNRGLLTVQSLVRVSRLDRDANSIEAVVTNGISFPKGFMTVDVGRSSMSSILRDRQRAREKRKRHRQRERERRRAAREEDGDADADAVDPGEEEDVHESDEEDETGQFTHDFFLCKVAVGKPYPISRKRWEAIVTGKEECPALPDGYHSFIACAEPDAEVAKTRPFTMHPEEYRHKFVLMDASQLLPCYYLRAEVDLQRDQSNLVCDVCERRQATLYCESDQANLCDECDRTVHAANKIVRRHTRVPIHQKRNIQFGACPVHPQQSVEFFCQTCQLPVCVHCKMVGSHSSGDAASHKLIEIVHAYEQAIKTSVQEDPYLLKQREKLMAQLVAVEERREEVTRNAKEVEAQLLQMVERVLSDLQKRTHKKLVKLSAEAVEVQRQMNEISSMEKFLQHQQSQSTPVQFLCGWQRHVQLRSQLYAPQTSHFELSVEPDLALDGSVRAVSKVELSQEARERRHRHRATNDDEEVLVSDPDTNSDSENDTDHTPRRRHKPRKYANSTMPTRMRSPASSASALRSSSRRSSRSSRSGRTPSSASKKHSRSVSVRLRESLICDDSDDEPSPARRMHLSNSMNPIPRSVHRDGSSLQRLHSHNRS